MSSGVPSRAVRVTAGEVQVQPRRGGDKLEAKVEFVAPEMDLALLTVTDEKFFEKRPALTRAKKLPKVQGKVAVYGFPVGGNDQSVTTGVVSRIDFGPYYEGGLGLIIQVSAAINPGNSGGPLVNLEGKVIGINSMIKTHSGGFQGVGLAISSNLAKSIMTQLVQNGSVKRGYLGIQIKEITDLAPDCRVNREEIFGPVVTVTPFRDEADVVRMANGTAYGLSASLWTRDLGLPSNWMLARSGSTAGCCATCGRPLAAPSTAAWAARAATKRCDSSPSPKQYA